MRTSLLAPVAAGLLLLAACGGDDEPDDAAGDATEASADDTTTTEAAADEGDCAGTDLTYTDVATGETLELTSAAAVSLADGAAYTAYAADFELTEADLGIVGVDVPADGNMVTLAVTVFNAEETPEPLEAGTEVEYTDEFGVLTFVVTFQHGEEALGNNTDAEGSVTITAVGDRFCAEVTYADAEKELAGTIEATELRDL